MSRHLDGPRAGSRAYLALEKLHDGGGQEDLAGWMGAASWSESVSEFDRMVVTPLLRYRLVFRRGNLCAIADTGVVYLGRAEAEITEPAPPAGPRYVAPMRPLSSAHRPKVRIMREGAFDYRGIPSLQGDQRTEFRSSLNLDGGDRRA